MMDDEGQTFYDALNISPDATAQEVREAYLQIKATFTKESPALYTLVSSEDREEMLKTIEEAYLVLSDPEKRKNYDQNFGYINSEENPFNQPINTSYGSSHTPIPNPANDNLVPIDRGRSTKTSQNETDQSFSRGFTGSTEIKTPSGAIGTRQSDGSSLVRRPAGYRSPPTYPEIGNELIQMIEVETEWRGHFLKRIREAYQISLEEMAGVTKVTKTYLIAIEEENFKKLPALVYIRGFIIQIAKVLKLPPETVAKKYLSRYTLGDKK